MHTVDEVTNELFEAVMVGDVRLANRLVMAPMTRNRAGAGNVPTTMMVEYYRQRATAGLIITEGAQILPEGQGYPNTPGIYSPEQVAGWSRITSAVHAKGGRLALQLWHVGRISHRSLQPNGKLPVAPSAIAARGNVYTVEGLKPFETPRALETAEIAGIVQAYAAAAKRSIAAGFDLVEIHAANGYLIDQFLRDGTNTRTDQYGGSLANRIRFLVEVATAVAQAVGAGRVGVRFSPLSPFNDMKDSNPEATFVAAAAALKPLGLAYLHVIEPVGANWRSASAEGDRLTPKLHAAFGGRLIANGGHTLETAESVLATGEADLVSFGVAFLANPDLVARLKSGAELNVPDVPSFYGGAEKGYTDYPALGGRGSG
ncbi:MAG: alkene reductase [Gemmatimonadales bacterium]